MFLFLSPLTFFGLPLFLFPFLCLSVASFLFTFLLVFLFSCLFVSCFCLFLSLSFFIAFVSWKEKHENIQLQFVFLNYFLFLLVSCLAFLFQIPFSYLCFFLILSYGFSSTSMFLVSKRTNWEAQKTKKNKLQQNGVYLWTCVLQNVKSYRFFFCPFFANFWLMFKKHYKNRYFSKFLKAKNWKKNAFWGVIIWAK